MQNHDDHFFDRLPCMTYIITCNSILYIGVAFLTLSKRLMSLALRSASQCSSLLQPETLEGENAYWCDTCHKPCRATKTLSYTHIPTILIIHLKRLILGEKIQTHIPFNTVLEMKPYLAPGQASPQTMELIGIISHQGTKEHGHYVAITKKGNEWISHNDAKVTQATLTQLHQTQAYIMIYRKNGS